MRIYASTGGSDEGLEIWEAWSRKLEGHGLGSTAAKRWAHFHKSPPTRTGFDKLEMLASAADPDWDKGLDRERASNGAGEGTGSADPGNGIPPC
jgi:hypothetical protein